MKLELQAIECGHSFFGFCGSVGQNDWQSRRDEQISEGLTMEFEFLAYRLVGLLPVLGVMAVGVFLAVQHRWRNPRVCMLVGIALLLAMGTYVFLPIILQLVMSQIEMGIGREKLVFFVHTFIYSSASAVVWGLVLFAIFGRDGIVHPPTEPDDDYE